MDAIYYLDPRPFFKAIKAELMQTILSVAFIRAPAKTDDAFFI